MVLGDVMLFIVMKHEHIRITLSRNPAESASDRHWVVSSRSARHVFSVFDHLLFLAVRSWIVLRAYSGEVYACFDCNEDKK
jgi:hypothetical protein